MVDYFLLDFNESDGVSGTALYMDDFADCKRFKKMCLEDNPNLDPDKLVIVRSVTKNGY